MVKLQDRNQSTITEFILLGFGDLPELQIFLFLVFLVIYLVTVAGNLLIMVLVWADEHLHTPMYFFLGNLSCLETCGTTNLVPRMMVNFLSIDKTISIQGCVIQFFVFSTLLGTEMWLLAIMSYDRYLAICKPLHYATNMNIKCCFQLVVAVCVSAFLCTYVLAFQMSKLHFCGYNEIDHFFCDFIPVTKLSCSDTTQLDITCFGFSFLFTVMPFLLTITSYICIITTILKIPSTVGRQKAFLTCSSHLAAVCIFFSSIIIVYMLPETPTLRELHKFFSVFYTILIPMINPLIYSLRNKEVHQAFKRVCSKLNIFVGVYLNSPLSFQFRKPSKP